MGRLIDPRWILIIGILLDIAGTILIALSILLIRTSLTDVKSLIELEEELQSQLDFEWNLTMVGIILIFVGFLFIFSDAIYESFIGDKKVL